MSNFRVLVDYIYVNSEVILNAAKLIDTAVLSERSQVGQLGFGAVFISTGYGDVGRSCEYLYEIEVDLLCLLRRR
jgi:hypothetical protein